MNRNNYSNSPHMKFEIHQVNSREKIRWEGDRVIVSDKQADNYQVWNKELQLLLRSMESCWERGDPDSPTSSILKTPTAIFVTSRNSSVKTKRLKFANGPVDLASLKNGTHDSNASFDSGVDLVEEKRSTNDDEINFENSVVEVAISPVKTMQVSPESWKAFLEYKKYNDYANETEKTDYTYSRLSKFRHKEIIPGFLIRPNLSRSSISSRRSSYSLPSRQSSFNEMYHSGSYDFNIHNRSNPEIMHTVKIPNQPNKFVRSKYFLRSSNIDWKNTNEFDSNSHNYLENEDYVHSSADNFSKTYSYSTTETPEATTTPYYGKVRLMEFDDTDIDEVDDNPVHSKKHYYTSSSSSSSNVGQLGVGDVQSQSVSNYFKNFFTTVFFYTMSVGTFTRDLFKKYILRRQSDWNGSSPSLQSFRSDGLNTSWIPWKDKIAYSKGNYYSDGYYGQPQSWYQKIYTYFNEKSSQIMNLIWGDTARRSSYRYNETSRKRRFWWFLIPLLIFTGSFLGYVDFFSNPKAILNTMYDCALFIPSFLHYTIMVFIPWLIFEAIPYLVVKAIPNFVSVTLPYFIMHTVPYYFWVFVHFLSNISFNSIWSTIVGASNFALTVLMTIGESFYRLYLFKAEQESGFISNQYKELDCRTNGFFTSVENAIKPIWRSGYVTYKKVAASASCYVNDSWERLKLPFAHINEWLCSKFSFISEECFGFLFAIWNGLCQGLWNIILLTRDTFSNLCLFFLDFFTDFLSAVNNVLYYFSRYFMDVFFSICHSLGWILGNAWKLLANTLRDLWSYLYLLVFVPRGEVTPEYESLDLSEKACLRQQKSIDKLTSEIQNFKSSIPWDLSVIKKKIDELEEDLKKEKEFRRSKNELLDKHLDDNYKVLQKYQTTINHALHSSKRPAHLSSSSVQYLLDNQSDNLKQWITQNFLLKSDSKDLDEDKIALLISKYGNKTGEELLALKEELQLFERNHKSELESLQKNFNALGANNLGGSDISLVFIKKLIDDAIKLYDADKTGRVDYALETAGGQVLSIRCTETYIKSPKTYVFMGWSVFTETSSPREAISPGMAAGQCWAFVGSQGFLVLQLSHTIRITGFTMEHISKTLVPRGHIESAPKNFSMWGLKHVHDLEPHLFGEYIYMDNDETLQYFPVTFPSNKPYNIVELKITSNHGNPNYTCLYRIRVHGDMNSLP